LQVEGQFSEDRVLALDRLSSRCHEDWVT
jgi:hypothetical protein